MNYLAILVSAIASFIIGMLWYSPLLFGKIWMKYSKITEADIKNAQNGMTKKMIIAGIFAIVMSYIFANLLQITSWTGTVAGLQLAIWLWLGFIIPIVLNSYLWEKKAAQVFFINIAHYLVAALVIGAILGSWA